MSRIPASGLVILGALCALLTASGAAGAARGSVPGRSVPGRAVPSAAMGSGTTAYQVPVSAPVRVVRRFEAPAGPYAPGHRGVDLGEAAGGAVLAAGAGVVDFAGPVAGRGVVVLRHPDGVRTEYEPIAPSVREGQAVAAGQRIGVLAGQHPGCAPSCLHWGARRGSTYFDPLRLLMPLGMVRLVPV